MREPWQDKRNPHYFYPCGICAKPITTCEMCEECAAEMGDPFPSDEESQRQEMRDERI